MNRNVLPNFNEDDVQMWNEPYGNGSFGNRSPANEHPLTAKITQGQLEAVALRFRSELDLSLQRTGTGATAKIVDDVLSIEIAHSLSAAEHNLMRRTAGRDFFQLYVEELTEQMYPTFVRHIEDILPVSVTYSGVRVDCDNDSIIFSFGIRTHICWTKTIVEASNRDYA